MRVLHWDNKIGEGKRNQERRQSHTGVEEVNQAVVKDITADLDITLLTIYMGNRKLLLTGFL